MRPKKPFKVLKWIIFILCYLVRSRQTYHIPSRRKKESKKRGLFHYDSLVWPYIATAINKGKWNTSEYSQELDALSKEYNVNLSERGTV